MSAFSRLVDAAERANGVKGHRRAFVPGSPVDKSVEELRSIIEGIDPITKRPFMDGVLELLTRPLDNDSLQGLSYERTTPRLVDPGTEEELQLLFRTQHWTDYLPIVLPTEERVEAMLAGTSRDRDEVVGRLSPTMYREAWEFTVEKVAVNAVMAGAEPAYFPLILALAASGMTARISSVTSLPTMAVVNGPIRDEIRMNYGIGALGPYNHANATVGRAYGLLSQNLQGGSVPGETYVGSLGHNFGYNNLLVVENEQASPWEPLHTGLGYGVHDSCVTILYPAWNYATFFGLRKTWREQFLHMAGAWDAQAGLVLILDPLVARELVEREGFRTKDQLVAWIHENATQRRERWWDTLTVELFKQPLAQQGVEPWASLYEGSPDDLIPVWQPDEITIVVTGGETTTAIAAAQGTRRATVSLDEWR